MEVQIFFYSQNTQCHITNHIKNNIKTKKEFILICNALLHVKKYKLKRVFLNLFFMSVTIFAVLYFSNFECQACQEPLHVFIKWENMFYEIRKAHCLEDKAFFRIEKRFLEVMETKQVMKSIHLVHVYNLSLTEYETTIYKFPWIFMQTDSGYLARCTRKSTL